MINLSNHRWFIVAGVHYIALFFIGQLNYYLAPLGLHLFVAGMLISFSAMELNFRQGVLSLIPIALSLDSKSPLPFGFALVVFLCLFTIAHTARSRVRREISASSLATSITLTMTAFGAYTIGAAWYHGPEGLHFGPIAMNLCASVVVVAALNRLFFQTQIQTLAFFGISLAEEQREAR